MFELTKIKGNTYNFDSYTNTGLFINRKGQVILIDSGDHKRTVRTLNKLLEERNLRPDYIICTHCHVDHIAGNRFFQEKYGTKILCSDKERMFIRYTDVEADISFNGYYVNKKLSPYYQAEPSDPEVINGENLPEGIEIIELPGHGWEMIGVRTEDNVVFLADSIMSVETWEEHKLPFFNDVTSAIETLEKIKEMKADVFVPSHSAPIKSIKELAQYNIDMFKMRKKSVYELCDGKNADDIFAALMNELDLEVVTARYHTYYGMVRHYIQALFDDKVIDGEFDGRSYIYKRK